jgi:hypothetical protein
MRSLSIQVQPDKSPSINMQRLDAAFEIIASDRYLVEHHSFSNGMDKSPYSNYTFGTKHALRLWESVQTSIYNNTEFGAHMRLASIVTCSSEEGWDDYLLLFHFDPAVELDGTNILQP